MKQYQDNYWEGFLTGATLVALGWSLVWFAQQMAGKLR